MKLKMTVFLQSLIVIVFGLVSAFCQISYTHILTRFLSLDLYGDFTVAWNSILLISSVVVFGSDLTTQRFLSFYQIHHNHQKKHDLIYWVLTTLLQSSMILACTYMLFWLIASIFHISLIYQFDSWHLAMFTVILAPFYAVFLIANSLIMGYGYILLATFLKTVFLNGIQLIVIYSFFNLVDLHGVTGLSSLIMCILVTIMLINTLITLLIPNNEIFRSLFTQQAHDHQDKQWPSLSRGFFINTVNYMLVTTMDLYIIEVFCPKEGLVGLYSICLSMISILFILNASLSNQLRNDIMNIKDMNQKQLKQLQKSLDIYNLMKLILLILAVGISWSFRAAIFSFFHVQTTYAYLLLPLMFFSCYLQDDAYPFAYLMANGQSYFVEKTRFIATIIMSLTGTILVFPLNIYGVALATMIARIFTRVKFIRRYQSMCKIRFYSVI
tara:strand:+ start:13267 stop:14586 length:1320 start_codon:yes stop_codon:yes gene_type:complete